VAAREVGEGVAAAGGVGQLARAPPQRRARGRSSRTGPRRPDLFHAEPAPQDLESRGAMQGGTMQDGTILLVEDNQDDVDLTLRAFKKNNIGNKVVVARDGVEALEHLFGAGRAPDAPWPVVVLLDLKLPRIDGLEVLRKIRANERTRTLPVVVLTSSDEQRDLIESYNLGANSYVRKPVDFGGFLEAARQLGLYWLVLNQAPPRPA
jgi:two-component system response regulator